MPTQTSPKTATEKTYREGGRITKPEAKAFLEGNALPDNNGKTIEFHDVVVHSVTRPTIFRMDAGIYSFYVEYRTEKNSNAERFSNDIPLRRGEDGNIRIVLMR